MLQVKFVPLVLPVVAGVALFWLLRRKQRRDLEDAESTASKEGGLFYKSILFDITFIVGLLVYGTLVQYVCHASLGAIAQWVETV